MRLIVACVSAVLLAAVIALCVRTASQDAEIESLRRTVETMERRQEYLPALFREHEERMKLWIEKALARTR